MTYRYSLKTSRQELRSLCDKIATKRSEAKTMEQAVAMQRTEQILREIELRLKTFEYTASIGQNQAQILELEF